MKKLDIISELRHMQEQSRTMANVLTTIIRQLEKDTISSPSDNNDLKKDSGFFEEAGRKFDDEIKEDEEREEQEELEERQNPSLQS